MNRIILIVMDSVGMGEAPDAEKYGDSGANTIGNISEKLSGLRLPNLEQLGLGNIDGMKGIIKSDAPKGCFGRLQEKSAGKDTTTGHWEIAGLILDKPFPVYPNGFPKEIIDEFEKAIGTKILGNYAASGTEIIKQLGSQHIKTGYPIVYTSADSVFQIAAHEDIIPVEKLYEMCKKARSILKGEHCVGRVIARPFIGTEGNFVRTDRRHDFAVDPFDKTVLDYLKEKGYEVKAVGKIKDIFNQKGITDAIHTHNNMDGVDKTIEYMKQNFEGLIFTNLVDFDMLYGHRNNVEGYATALKEFDSRIPDILSAMKKEDILFITADHGCDPTTPSTDHTREYVPFIAYGEKLKEGINIGTRDTFGDVAATISEYFNLNAKIQGKSFLKDILR